MVIQPTDDLLDIPSFKVVHSWQCQSFTPKRRKTDEYQCIGCDSFHLQCLARTVSKDRENIERLEITGVGDPSGWGLGFSYVRIAPKAPLSNVVKKKMVTVNGGSTVTGTDADLRRLSMDAAREHLPRTMAAISLSEASCLPPLFALSSAALDLTPLVQLHYPSSPC